MKILKTEIKLEKQKMISEKKLRSRRLPRVCKVCNHKILNFVFAAFLIFCGICGAKSQSFSKTQAQSRSQRENSASQKSFFWENAKEISAGDSYFPQAVSSGKKSFVFFEQADKKSKNVRISYSECENSKNWSGIKNLGGKIAYSGEKVPVLSEYPASHKKVLCPPPAVSPAPEPSGGCSPLSCSWLPHRPKGSPQKNLLPSVAH